MRTAQLFVRVNVCTFLKTTAVFDQLGRSVKLVPWRHRQKLSGLVYPLTTVPPPVPPEKRAALPGGTHMSTSILICGKHTPGYFLKLCSLCWSGSRW